MKKSLKKEKGLALLIVVLVGAIMILTSMAFAQYTLKLLKSTQARSDAVQDLYNAESSFECVKYWLHKDYRNFADSTLFGGPVGSGDVVCNNTTFNFNTMTNGESYTTSGTTGIGSFNIPNDTGGAIKVEVERNTTQNLFDGTVRIYSQSNSVTTNKNEERYQSYKYMLLHGADIMFVVDRSGSITGDRTDRSANDEWNSMLDAVNASIRVLAQNVPAPYIGLLSFGTDPGDTGQHHSCSGYSNCRIPDVPLTDTSGGIGVLIDDKGTPTRDDDTPNMDTAVAATNLSLGISIAGAELMGKYYPDGGPGGAGSGMFEKIVADDLSFSSLPNQPIGADGTHGADRNDTQYRDVIVVVTDGAPNGIITHISGQTWYRSPVLSSPYNFINPVAHTYQLGEVKLFRTPSNGLGSMIVDNNDGAFPALPSSSLYRYCNDNTLSSNRPNSGILDSPNNTYAFNPDHIARMPMCNATLIADKLKNDENITFIAVYVYGSGMTEAQARATPEAQWLANDFVSSHDGQPLLGLIKRENYDQLMDTIMALFEQLDIVESR